MRQKFFILIFVFFCFSSVFALDLDIPLKNFELNGVSVDRITLTSEAKKVTFFITVTDEYLADFNDVELERLSRLYLNSLISLKIDFTHLNIMLRSDKNGEYKHITEFLPALPPVPKKEAEYEGGVSKRAKRSLVPQTKYGNIQGALSGKTLFVSAGHGWTYNLNYDDSGELKSQYWATQRDVSQGMREDDSNAEIVSYFLIPYLQNAGGTVFSARERDRQENMVIIDDADGTSYSDSDGIYEESGGWAETTDTNGYGYGRTDYPMTIDVNPLRSGRYRYANAEAGAWARWTPRIPKDGSYHVYVSYKAGTNRTTEALYTVKHAGGSSEVKVNQQHHGSTWIDLGQFYFKAGLSRENGSVMLSGTEGIIIADAVRFGGGKGLIKRGVNTTLKVSGYPRWEESAVHNVQFMGAPSGSGNVYHRYNSQYNDRDDDVAARSRWAAWENEEDYDDSLYIAFHSNAVNSSSVTGLSTWIYSNQAAGVGYEAGQAAAGSEKLATLVHERILNSVKTLFRKYEDEDKYEYGSGLYSAYFGEINPSNNNEMPSVLVELAFHSSPTDSEMLRDPKYRDIASRAAYQAIVQYFAQKDGTEAVFLPGAPRNLAATTYNNSKLAMLLWDAPETDEDRYLGDAPEGYIIQTSLDGVSFNDGVETTATQGGFSLNDYPDGTVLFVRVLAYNKGGVSFPSAVAPIIVSRKKEANILIVDGFERIDSAMPRFNDGTSANHRYILEHINSFDYARYYAHLLAELGYSFDFMPRTWITEFYGSASIPSKYDAILWFLGEQSTADETFNHEEEEKITDYLDNGGALFVSGAEIGWDLDYKGDDADKTFFNETLNTKYVADKSGLYTFFGADDFSVSGWFDDGTYIYQAEYADVLAPFDENTGKTVIFYDDTQTLGAGVLTNTDSKKVFVLGFPFETILDDESKKDLLKYVFDGFGIAPKEDTDDPIEDPDDAPESDAPDEDSADTGSGDQDEGDTDTADPADTSDPTDTSDTTDTSDSSDSSDTSDPSDSSDSADSTDTSDSSDPADLSDSGDTSESDQTDEEKGGKGGCSVLTL